MATTKTMTESTRNTGKPWTQQEVRELKQLAKENTPTRVIGLKLGRTPRAIQSKAAQERISLAPPNRSPHGRVDNGGSRRGSKQGSRSSTGRGRAAKTSGARKRTR